MSSIWSTSRLRDKDRSGDLPGWRSDFQQDYDRLLFSTPVRRLADKTQVWPMDDNDGVRTRLTHSHEVANLARSVGSRIVSELGQDIFGGADLHQVIQPILSSIGLAHDLGNPPFGHQGEAAISNWFRKRERWIFNNVSDQKNATSLAEKDQVPDALRKEFTSFDGNPQGFRLIARLQTHVDRVGLDLTAGTLAALLKYPVGAKSLDEEHPFNKKVGYFESERAIIDRVRNYTGLEEGQRHPLAWILEACDDIAYSILDVDDVMKKKIISPDDVLAILVHDERSKSSSAVKEVQDRFLRIQASDRDADVARDIKIGYLRAFLIEELIQSASQAFIKASEAIFAYIHEEPLMDSIPLCNALKDVAKRHAFSNPAVLKTEAIGAAALDGLMSFFWRSIHERKDPTDIGSKRTTALAKYGWSLVSPNYIEEACRKEYDTKESGAVRYRELRLLTDMVSGMTDTFALKLWMQVKDIPG